MGYSYRSLQLNVHNIFMRNAALHFHAFHRYQISTYNLSHCIMLSFVQKGMLYCKATVRGISMSRHNYEIDSIHRVNSEVTDFY